MHLLLLVRIECAHQQGVFGGSRREGLRHCRRGAGASLSGRVRHDFLHVGCGFVCGGAVACHVEAAIGARDTLASGRIVWCVAALTIVEVVGLNHFRFESALVKA